MAHRLSRNVLYCTKIKSTDMDANFEQVPPILSAQELIDLKGFSELVLVDLRNSNTAKADYLESHLEGAIYIE
jgi:hypothetical protein